MAVFPRGIKSFPIHKNLLDDVKAEHVNDLQDEVVAIQEVLGPLVNEVNELNLEMDQDDVDDEGALRKITLQFKSIGAQLAALRRGSHIPVFSAAVTNKWYDPEQAGPTVPYRLLSFPKPATDTHKSYNGYGLTLPKTGFYLIRAQTNWDVWPLPLSAGYGTYSSVISINGHGNFSTVRTEHYNPEIRGVYQAPLFLGAASRGSKVKLLVNQNSDRRARVNSAYLSSVMLRELP
jgi:hypothetical protein